MNYFEVLGVSLTATDAEISAAHKRLAAQFHPDRHPEAGPAERAAWTQMMATINEAWDTLRDPARRATYRASIAEQPVSSTPSPRPPYVGECDICGSKPAANFSFRHQHAYLFAASAYSTDLELCRSCAQAIGRSKQNRTLIGGWWGVLSFFRNIANVFGNASALNRASSMAPPSRSEAIATPMARPLDPGKSVFARSGIWLTAAVVFVAGAAIATSAKHKADNSTPFVPPAPAAAATWRVGSCITGFSTVYPVSCSQAHTGKIVSTATTAAGCGFDTESYVEDGSFVWCIDENL